MTLLAPTPTPTPARPHVPTSRPRTKPSWRRVLAHVATRRVRAVRRGLHARQLGCAITGAGTAAAGLVFMLWFRTGQFYARGDLAPFVRDGLRNEFGWQWTHQNTGAGGPTYELVRGIELVFLSLAHALGGTDALGERLFFAAVLALAASGAAACAARLVARPWIVFAAGVIGACNPLTMVNLPNVLVPLAIGLGSWFTALMLDAAIANRAVRPRLFALLSIPVSYLALNPPLLTVLGLWIAVLPIAAAVLTTTGRAGTRRGYGLLGRSVAWAAPLALWWLVPYAVALHIASASGTINANTDVFSWSWTHAHGSLDRVLGLFAKWSWPDTTGGTNGSVMSHPHWLWLAFVLPVGLLAAPLAARARCRRPALWLVAVALAAAFIGKGLNAPLKSVNGWMYAHLPPMVLLREPMGKIGILLVPAVLLGWVLTVDGLAARGPVDRHERPVRATLGRAGMVALVVAPVVFAAPMLTGTVVRSSDRVRIPAAWYQVARIVDDAPLQGKALVLPLDDFYQIPTTWGFYGADTLPIQLMHRPTITRNPQRYIGDSGDFEQLVQAVQDGIVGGDPEAVPGALRALGVSHIIVRKDIDFASPIRAVQMTPPGPLLAGLASVAGVRHVATTKVADVFEFAPGSDPVVALSGTIAAPGAHGEALASLVSDAPAGTAIATVEPDRAPLYRGESWYLDVNGSRTIVPPGSGDWLYHWHTSDTALFELARGPGGIVLREPVTIKVGPRPLATRRDALIPATAPVVAVGVDGAIVDLSSGRSYARIAPGTAIQPYVQGTSTTIGAWSTVGDCDRYDNRPADLRVGVHPSPAGGVRVQLVAGRHAACVSAPLATVAPNDVLHISLEEHSVQGAPPRTCLWEAGLQDCARLEWSARRDGVWYALSATYRVPSLAGALEMYLYADEPAPGTDAFTDTRYRNVEIQHLGAGRVVRVMPAQLPAGSVHLAAGPVSVSTFFDAPTPVVGDASEAADCARAKGRTLQDAGIAASSIANDGVRLSARRDIGCVTLPVFGLAPSISYELSFDARTERGAPPRVCLWEQAAFRCATFEPVLVPRGDHGEYRYRGHIDADASSWNLFLYADPADGGTVVDYANVRVRPIADEALVLRPAHVDTPPVPAMTWKTDGPARYRVHVRNASAPFVLALADAFSRDWRVRGLPHGTSLKPVEIDGYRNGWLIDARGNLDLTIEYAPARFGRDAAHVSQVAGFLLFASFARSRYRRRRPRRRGRARPGPRRVSLEEADLPLHALST